MGLPRPPPCRRRVTLARWMSARETEWHPVRRGRHPHPAAAPRARGSGASVRSPQASCGSWKHEESTAQPAPGAGGEGRRACDPRRSRARAAPRSPATGEARNRVAERGGGSPAPRDPPGSLDRAGTILTLGGHPSAIHSRSQRAPVHSSRRPPLARTDGGGTVPRLERAGGCRGRCVRPLLRPFRHGVTTGVRLPTGAADRARRSP